MSRSQLEQSISSDYEVGLNAKTIILIHISFLNTSSIPSTSVFVVTRLMSHLLHSPYHGILLTHKELRLMYGFESVFRAPKYYRTGHPCSLQKMLCILVFFVCRINAFDFLVMQKSQNTHSLSDPDSYIILSIAF